MPSIWMCQKVQQFDSTCTTNTHIQKRAAGRIRYIRSVSRGHKKGGTWPDHAWCWNGDTQAAPWHYKVFIGGSLNIPALNAAAHMTCWKACYVCTFCYVSTNLCSLSTDKTDMELRSAGRWTLWTFSGLENRPKMHTVAHCTESSVWSQLLFACYWIYRRNIWHTTSCGIRCRAVICPHLALALWTVAGLIIFICPKQSIYHLL